MSDALAALRAAKSYLEFWGNDNPKCPHCGHDYDISKHGAWDLYDDDDDHEVECPSCDRPYRVVTLCSYTFSTDEQDGE